MEPPAEAAAAADAEAVEADGGACPGNAVRLTDAALLLLLL